MMNYILNVKTENSILTCLHFSFKEWMNEWLNERKLILKTLTQNMVIVKRDLLNDVEEFCEYVWYDFWELLFFNVSFKLNIGDKICRRFNIWIEFGI